MRHISLLRDNIDTMSQPNRCDLKNLHKIKGLINNKVLNQIRLYEFANQMMTKYQTLIR